MTAVPLPGPAPSRARPSRSPAGRTSSRRCGRSFPAPRARGGALRSSAASRARGRAGSCGSSRTTSPRTGHSSCTATATASSAPPYGPSPRCSSSSSASSGRTSSASTLGAHGTASSVACLPGLPARSGGSAERPAVDADTQRHRLHTAVTDALTNASRRSPLLLVLEDVHWADAPTLLLLRHLVRAGADGAHADRRHISDSAGGDHPRPRRHARRRLANRGCDPDPARRAHRRRDRGVRPPHDRRRARRRAARHDVRADRWQRVPRHGALAGAGRLRCDRRHRRHCSPHQVGGRARHADDRARGREPAARAPRAGDDERCSSSPPSPGPSSTSRRCATRLSSRPTRCSPRSTRRSRAGSSSRSPGRALSYRFVHELVRRAVADRLSAVRKAETHLVVARALADSPSRGDSRGPACGTRPPLRRGGGRRRSGARCRVQPARCGVRRPARSPSRTPRPATGRRSSSVIDDPRERAGLCSGSGTPPGEVAMPTESIDAFRRVAELARDARRHRAPRPGRDRVRGRLLATGDSRRGHGRAPRGGGSGARRGRLRAPRPRARRLRPGPRPARRPDPGCAGPRRVDRDVAPPR